MALLSSEAIVKYIHSPVHHAVACKDHACLRKILARLPQLAEAGTIRTEEDAMVEESKAEALAKVIDSRDVPGRETPLHLAVRMGDSISAEILMASGADWSLQNEQGWSALQEAICTREEAIALVIMRYYQPMAWAKWCRRLPCVIGTMNRMMDFYMEVTFHFESSVIPFIGRIAPSDTYRIWKRGSNLRADMTLAGFDGFKIQRSDQSFLFLGEGSKDGKLSPGSLCILKHKKRQVLNALEGAGMKLTEKEVAHEVAAMSQTNMYRPGIDVTQAVLLPQLNWRRQEKTEMVGGWKTKVYDMLHVLVSVKSRRVPGAMTDEELFEMDAEDVEPGKDYVHLLTEEEKKQLDLALIMENADIGEGSFHNARSQFENTPRVSWSSKDIDEAPRLSSTCASDHDRKGWLAWGNRRSSKQEGMKNVVPARKSVCIDEKVSNLLGDDVKKGTKIQRGRMSVDARPSNFRIEESHLFRKDIFEKTKPESKETIRKRRVTPTNDGTDESEYKKSLRPVLWLTPNFPLKTEEMLPLLDILANKVKAVRRLRELLTTKLPTGTFPVKVAIPVVPTIKVIITFTKFEQLRSNEAAMAPSSSVMAKSKDDEDHGTSWFSWIKESATKVVGMSSNSDEGGDPFSIPKEYAWTSIDAKKHRSKDKKVRKGKKQP